MIEMSTATRARCTGEGDTASGPRKIVGVLSVECILTAEGLIWLTASAGQSSDDPLVKAIVRHAHEHRMRLGTPHEVQAIAAGGLEAVVDGRTVLVGTRPELERAGMSLDPVSTQARLLEAAGLAVIYAAVDRVLAGGIVLGADACDDLDVLPPTSNGGTR